MLETIALVIALICLLASETGAAVFFVGLSVVAAAWRAYQTAQDTRKHAAELTSLRAELHNAKTLAERAVRIAAETNNELSAYRSQGTTVVPPPPKPAAPEPKPEKPPEITPRTPEVPVSSASVRPPAPIAPKIEAPAPPPAPPKPVLPPPQPVSAPPRVAPPHPPVFAAAAPPRKPLKEGVRSALAIEEVLGTNWLNKIGVIILVLGIALFGVYELGQLGPFGKVGLSLAASLALLIGGIYLERKERYRILGRTCIGGGWALLFFTAYALNHVDAMRITQSTLADSILMFLVAGVMVLHTLRYRSQLVTGFAFLLAYSTIALSHDTVYSLLAGAILGAAIVAIVIRMSWFELEVFAILSSYGNHFYWLYRLLGARGAQGHPFPEFTASAALILFYWAIFRFSYVVRKLQSAAQENISTIAALLNPILLLAVMKFQSARPELAFYALLVLGALEFAIGQLPLTRKRRTAFVTLTMIGSALMVAAVPFKFSGQNVSILWLTGGEVLLFAGIFAAEPLFRRIGLFIGLIVSVHVLAVELPQMIALRGKAPDAPIVASGVMLLVMAVVFYGNTTLLRLRWPKVFTEPVEDWLLTLSSYPGVLTLGLACWALFVRDSLAVSFGVAMLAIALISYWVKSLHLQVQCFLIAAAAMFCAVTINAHWDDTRHLTARIVSLSALAALFYVSARFVQHRETGEQYAFRSVFAAFGTALVALLLYVEVPHAWQALAFAVFAWLLIEAGSLLRYPALRWHTHVMAAIAFVFAATFDLAATPLWHSVHTGLWKVLPVVAVLYLLAHRGATLYSQGSAIVRGAYSWAGTALALWLIDQSVDRRYVAAAWVLYALALMAVARWRHWMAPAWQAFVIGAMSAIHAGAINLLLSTPNSHDPIRLWVTCTVIAGLYLMSELLLLPEKWHQAEFERFHAWLATALTAMLLWYELTPVAIAVAWAVLGLVLYEYGAFRKAAQFRWQAYLILLASFVRIFFANLTAGATGDLLSSRMITVLPIAAIFYYVYSREAARATTAPKFNLAPVFAYLGTGATMALIYFQFPEEWVVTAWAAMVMAMLAMALLTKQNVFAQHSVLISLSVLIRGMIHNLFGGSYFTGSDWRGRFFVLGTAILLLFATLPLAFVHRRRSQPSPQSTGLRRMLAIIVQRAEQPIFFVAVALLTTMLALKMDHGRVTLAWGVEAVLIFIAALLVKERSFRLTGLALLLLCVAKILFIDVWHLAPRDKYLTFIGLGASLILVSFLYSKYRETIRQYL